MGTNPSEQQTYKDIVEGSILKEEWQQKDYSALFSSLPLQLLQEDIDMAIKQQQHIQQQQPAKEDITTAIKQQNIQQQQLIQENIAMAIQQQNTQQQNTHQQNTQQQSTHQRIQGDITSHFVNASTPLLGILMHTGGIQPPFVVRRVLGSATLIAKLTVETSNLLPAHQGVPLP